MESICSSWRWFYEDVEIKLQICCKLVAIRLHKSCNTCLPFQTIEDRWKISPFLSTASKVWNVDNALINTIIIIVARFSCWKLAPASSQDFSFFLQKKTQLFDQKRSIEPSVYVHIFLHTPKRRNTHAESCRHIHLFNDKERKREKSWHIVWA